MGVLGAGLSEVWRLGRARGDLWSGAAPVAVLRRRPLCGCSLAMQGRPGVVGRAAGGVRRLALAAAVTRLLVCAVAQIGHSPAGRSAAV